MFYKADNQPTIFTLDKFHEIIALPEKFKITDIWEKILPNIEKHINRKLIELQKDYPISAEKLAENKEKWKVLGLLENNSYQFIQGHFIFDTTVKLLTQICYSLKMAKIDNIWRSVQGNSYVKIRNKQAKAVKAKVSEYEQNIIPIEVVLQLNDKFENTFLWEKLNQDFAIYKSL